VLRRRLRARRGHPYTVVLYFSEPDGLAAGQRVFDIRVQGARVASGFDVAHIAGAADRTVRRAIPGVRVGDTLRVDFRPRAGSAHPPMLSGVELIRE
jgi:hypothetical protein